VQAEVDTGRALAPLLGATPVAVARVDRNRITGGGVTAGIDFGCTWRPSCAGRTSPSKSSLNWNTSTAAVR